MTGLFAGMTMSQIITVVSMLGPTGLILIFWYTGQLSSARYLKELGKQHQDHKDLVAEILKDYKRDVDQVRVFYERNVELVERYEKLADDLSDIIHLNTQVQTQLVESIRNNMYCPMVRQAGPGGA